MSETKVTLNPAARGRLSEVDASFKWPAIIFVVASVVWLLIGTALALVASMKLHTPGFLAHIEELTFGRARSAHLNAMAFGWGNNAAFAIALWVMARLAQSPLRSPWLLYAAALFWNVGLLYGISGILTGSMTSVEWLEMPMQVAPILAIAYVMVGLSGLLIFKYRQSGHVYVSQWYILGAIFWFPWLYTIAQIMILWIPARGVVQPLTNWWFAHNVLGLWLTPIGVATAYYLIPKVLGKPIHSYYLSLIGFWSLALFYNWAGVHHLVGGPFPAWLISSGIVGSIMMFVPVVVTAINHHMTVIGSWKKVWESPTLRFVVFGALNYTFSSLLGSTMALRSVNQVTHFTHFTVGHAHHGLYAFFTMIMFGAIYFMLPRLIAKEWPSAFMIKLHWWCAAIGITIMVVGLQVGGWIQGKEMNNADIPFLGIFLTLAASWTGLIYMGNLQLGGLEPVSSEVDPVTKKSVSGEPLHPTPLSGIAKQGKAVYIDQGCMYCHSQQVRRKTFGADYARGWGDRQSVPRDYIWEERVLLGTSRTGPDLKSVGTRLSDPSWHYLHLYNPQITSPGSIMQPFPYLFTVQPIKDGKAHPLALKLPPAYAAEVPAGHEVIPTARAVALVQYLLELRLDYDLPELKRQ